jgi:hypothetical protein
MDYSSYLEAGGEDTHGLIVASCNRGGASYSGSSMDVGIALGWLSVQACSLKPVVPQYDLVLVYHVCGFVGGQGEEIGHQYSTPVWLKCVDWGFSRGLINLNLSRKISKHLEQTRKISKKLETS